jgi:large subunit ribosomal protein L15
MRDAGSTLTAPGLATSDQAFHFEGGQMALARRLPKRGFHNPFRTTYRIVNVGALGSFSEGETVDPETLERRGVVAHGRDGVKLLGEGEAPRGLVVRVHKASASARKKIEDAGGTVEIIG